MEMFLVEGVAYHLVDVIITLKYCILLLMDQSNKTIV